jgi:hypothetical protein
VSFFMTGPFSNVVQPASNERCGGEHARQGVRLPQPGVRI